MMKPADYEKMADDCDRIANRIPLADERDLLRSFAERLRREAAELRRRDEATPKRDG
jgi:hypothetical protein